MSERWARAMLSAYRVAGAAVPPCKRTGVTYLRRPCVDVSP
jgi:hypothetical protein